MYLFLFEYLEGLQKKLSWNCKRIATKALTSAIDMERRRGRGGAQCCLWGFGTCKMFTQHTHKLSLAQTDRKTSQTEFHGEKWRIAVVAVAVATDDVTTALRRRRIAFQCCFAALLLHFVLPMAHPAALCTPAPILHTLTNLQRLTYLTCWHALNRMSDVGRGTRDEGRHCSKARNTLRQFAAAKRADDGEWRRMTVERRTHKKPAATADATRVIRGIQFHI